jgi:hypothetical protein
LPWTPVVNSTFFGNLYGLNAYNIIDARYRQVGKTVHFKYTVETDLGVDTSNTDYFSSTLPVPAKFNDYATVTSATGNGSIITYTASNNFAAGQNVTVSGLGVPTATVTAAVGNGTRITYTAANNFVVGQIVNVTGLGAASGGFLNKVVTVETASSTQFTFLNATIGVANGTGTATPTSSLNTNGTVVSATSTQFTISSTIAGNSSGSGTAISTSNAYQMIGLAGISATYSITDPGTPDAAGVKATYTGTIGVAGPSTFYIYVPIQSSATSGAIRTSGLKHNILPYGLSYWDDAHGGPDFITINGTYEAA